MSRIKISIDDLKKIALDRGGLCLSDEYKDPNVKLKWRCAYGHEWIAKAYNINKGYWCSKCSGTKKLTIGDMVSIAVKKGGECLSDKYINNRSKLRWRCKHGHEWESSPKLVKKGTWCPFCAGNNKKSLHDMHVLAKKKRGKCLSNEYINSSTKIIWECEEGHVWKATPGEVAYGTWCLICSGKKKLKLNDLKRIAKQKGGKCISKKYVNIHSKALWECSKGHRWEARTNDIIKGHWCPICGGSYRLTIEEMKKIALERDGRCLSKKYINANSTLIWQCREGHQWEAKPSMIKNGTWCPICSGSLKLTIKEMREIALSRGGECISTNYVNCVEKLTWACNLGHKWRACPGDVKRGSWCPYCRRYRSEEICRILLEEFFGCKFEKFRPSWLKTECGNQMELDGFSKELNIGFEHQGRQHFSYVKYFHRNGVSDYYKQITRDRDKYNLCLCNNIKIIYIPELFYLTKTLNDLYDLLLEWYFNNNIKTYNHVNIESKEFKLKLNKLYDNSMVS